MGGLASAGRRAPGPLVEALKQYLHVPPAAFLRQDLPGRWREFSGAVLIAMALHLTIVAILARADWPAVGGESSRRLGLILGILAAAFLAVAAIADVRQDYYFYLEIWYHVRQGHDPWFTVPSANGQMPLNAYGPLFNLLAVLAWINPAAPRLLLSYAYILFAIAMSRGFAAGRPHSGLRTFGLIALFWNPFVWIEVAFYGHLDILVGLACLGAVRAWPGGRDIRSGSCLAAGVLLKYLPIVLVPFLALDRDRYRFRLRFLAASLVAIAVGLGASLLVWGPSTFSPLELAATRRSEGLSIFRFFRGPYSPLIRFGFPPNDPLPSPIAQLLGLGAAWWWSRVRKPDIEASALVAVLVLLSFYRVGHPQYQMVPFVLASSWLLRDWDCLRNRTALVVAMALYFGWLASYDVAYVLHEACHVNIAWESGQDAVGLPTFLLAFAFLVCVVRAATAGKPGAVHRPHAAGMTSDPAQPDVIRSEPRSEDHP